MRFRRVHKRSVMHRLLMDAARFKIHGALRLRLMRPTVGWTNRVGTRKAGVFYA